MFTPPISELKFIAEPIRRPTGELFAIEILTRFKINSDIEKIFKFMTRKNKEFIFEKQIYQIVNSSIFFNSNNIICTLNIDEDIGDFLLSRDDLMKCVYENKFIHLEISETFNFNNKLLFDKLSKLYRLWLDDFGSNSNTLYFLENNRFKAIKIDKFFYWDNRKSFYWPRIVKHLKKHCDELIVEGIETNQQLIELSPDITGVQGFYYEPVDLDKINSLNIYI